jgi:hypothetical protein
MKRKIFNILLVFTLVVVGVVCIPGVGVMADEKETGTYTIDEAWDYTVTPGMDEWKSYITPEQKQAASYVPEDVLKNMTTNALVETVLNYPLLVDIYAFNTPYIGYQAVSSNFYGLTELASRSDAINTLQNYSKEYYSDINAVDITYYYIDTLIDCITKDTASVNIKKYNTSRSPILKYTITSVRTPRHTEVPAYRNLSWLDFLFETNQAQQEFARDQYLVTYPSTEVIGDVSPKYNCHSYAWHLSSISNNYWINDPSAYMTDGSYEESSVDYNAKVFYDSSWGSLYDHSGIVYSIYSTIKVKSKWGCCALFSHHLTDCPYANYGLVLNSYWIRS